MHMGKQRLEICIVDDEVVVCRRLQQALEKDGHRVETFVSSRLAVARIAQTRFDLVVTDIRMDEIDGMEVLDAVMAKREDTQVIMITGYATAALAEEAKAKGAFGFLPKPFRPADLRDVLGRATAAVRADSAG
jgi:DNA-binding NtrC family response regulator